MRKPLPETNGKYENLNSMKP